LIKEKFSTSKTQPVRVSITINKETWLKAHQDGGSIMIMLAPDNPICQMLADMIHDIGCLRPQMMIYAPMGESEENQEIRGPDISNPRVEHWLVHYKPYKFTEHDEEAFMRTSIHVLKKVVENNTKWMY
jgi:hypothetical protein